MDLGHRARAFLKLSRFTGVEVTAQFIRKTYEHFPEARIRCLHNLAEGIFKPAEDQYALSIWSRSAAGSDTEIYPDEFKSQKDGSWIMYYSAKNSPLESKINKSLFNCMRDKVPVLVIFTSLSKETPGGARYKILGPAVIETFNPSTRKFLVRGCNDLVVSRLVPTDNSVDSAELSIRNRLILPFYIKEDRKEYQISRDVREKAFRKIVLEEYRNLCVVCHSKFFLKLEGKDALVEAEAAHIISVEAHGPDDPRNGLSLCKRHHWAFEQGLFTITDATAVKISPSVLSAERRRFDLEEYDSAPIISPVDYICRPNEDALHWHQRNKFLKL